MFDISEVLLGVLQIQHAARCPDTTATVSNIVDEDGTVVEPINHLCGDRRTDALIESLPLVRRREDVLHFVCRREIVSADQPIGLEMKYPVRASEHEQPFLPRPDFRLRLIINRALNEYPRIHPIPRRHSADEHVRKIVITAEGDELMVARRCAISRNLHLYRWDKTEFVLQIDVRVTHE